MKLAFKLPYGGRNGLRQGRKIRATFDVRLGNFIDKVGSRAYACNRAFGVDSSEHFHFGAPADFNSGGPLSCSSLRLSIREIS
jgi:hypothetical protein